MDENQASGVWGWIRRHPAWSLVIYATFVITSNIVDTQIDLGRSIWAEQWADARGARTLEIETDGLPIDGETISHRVIIDGDLDRSIGGGRAPVLLLHGSPGGAIGFDAFAPALSSETQRAVISFDLPGFVTQSGAASYRHDDFSADAIADLSWRILDTLGLERVHLVGWSNGGAVALRMIEADPDRAASLTMLASVGVQETEGSGSWFFEHTKYKAGYAALVWGGRVLPHFGAFGPASERRAFLKNFDDTDQRPLRGIMENLETPTLILHGRNDFLTPAWGAERHHEIIPTSSLVMTDGGHFIPFLRVDEGVAAMAPFFSRHDAPGMAPETGVDDRSPVPERAGLGRVWASAIVAGRDVPWWAWVMLIAPLTVVLPRITATVAAMLVAAMTLDFGVALVGLWIGAGVRYWKREPSSFPGWLGVLVRPALALTALWILSRDILVSSGGAPIMRMDEGLLELAFALYGFGIIASVALGSWFLWLAELLLTPWGLWRLRTAPRRWWYHEHWPAWFRYLMILPGLLRLGLTYGARSFTCVNPGIPHGGGIAGESKVGILRGLGDAGGHILPWREIPPGDPSARAFAAVSLMRDDPAFAGYPVVCKPDVGEQGRGVTLAHTDDDIHAFLLDNPGPSMLQRYHPGPVELGVLWRRRPERDGPADDGLAGRVVAVTRKVRPTVTGDGRRSIARLVLTDPELRPRARALLGKNARRVPGAGEVVELGRQGNHARGAVFLNASELITPDLERVFDTIASSYHDAEGRGLDVGRFDVRATAETEAALGRGLGVIELNGVTGEPANIYHPGLPWKQARRMLLTHWSRVFRLGAARRREGARPMPWSELVSLLLGWR